MRAYFYPEPTGVVPTAEVFEVHAGASDLADVIADDTVCRDHPEVPLTDAERDQALARLGYRRTGPWQVQPGGRAEAPVQPVGEGR